MTRRGREQEAAAIAAQAARECSQAMALLPRDRTADMIRGELRAAQATCVRACDELSQRATAT